MPNLKRAAPVLGVAPNNLLDARITHAQSRDNERAPFGAEYYAPVPIIRRVWTCTGHFCLTVSFCHCKMLFPILTVAGFLAVKVNAIIPLPCANVESLGSRTCCPVPDSGAGQCGVNLGRGSCEPISIPESEFVSSETDIRKKWPIQYFNSTCKCNVNYGGFDCGECSFGYNDGGACETKTVLPRVSVSTMDETDWMRYHAALRAVKDTASRYMVAKSNFPQDLQALMDSLVRPNTYDLFTWIHHLMAKDNEFTKCKPEL